ncbi:MAG: TrkA family potassium uptake protein [Candidatus Obscuribacterales bacterium]
MKRRLSRFFRLVRVLVNEFRVFFTCVLIAFVGSTLLLYYVYPKQDLPQHHATLLGAAYDTLQMIFFESPIPFEDDWRLIPLFFGLPLLGLLVVAEGVVHLGNLLFQSNLYTREWQKMLAATYENHIVVCGLGNVGMRVVQHLRAMDQDVVCIEKQPDAPFLAEMEELGVPCIVANIRNTQALEDANVRKAKALIAVTDDDLANMETCLNARELVPGIKVVMRMFDQKLAEKFERSFGIPSFSASALSAPVFALAAMSGNILSSFEFGGQIINAIQIPIEDGGILHGLTVDDVRQRYGVTVLLHEHGGQNDWNPAAQTVLHSGTKLLAITDSRNVHRVLG